MSKVNEIHVLPAEATDADFFYRVNKAALGKYIELTWGWDEAQQRRLHEEKWHTENSYVIVTRGRAIGTLRYEETKDRVYVRSLCLLPEWQNRRLGTRLMRQIMDAASEKNLPVVLHVLKVNPASKLYERLGFRVVDENKTHFEMEFTAPGTNSRSTPPAD